MRGIRDRLGLEIWRAMGFEPIVDSNGRLAKMIVRAWTDLFSFFLILTYEQGPEAGTYTASRVRRRTGGRRGNLPSARPLVRTDTDQMDHTHSICSASRGMTSSAQPTMTGVLLTWIECI